MTAAAPEGKSDKPQEEAPVKYNTEFGYSRKDVTLITLGLIALGYVLYYGAFIRSSEQECSCVCVCARVVMHPASAKQSLTCKHRRASECSSVCVCARV